MQGARITLITMTLLGVRLITDAGLSWGSDPRNLLDPKKLAAELKLDPAQVDTATALTAQARALIDRHQWEYARMTCEAALWKGAHPSLDTLKALKKSSLLEIEKGFHAFRETLSKDRRARLDRMMKGWERLLDLPTERKIPFYYVDTRPLFNRLENEREVSYTSFEGGAAPDTSRSYADVVRVWTARTYIGTVSTAEDANRLPGIAETSDIGIRALPTTIRGKLVNSPLIIAATMMSPEVQEAEASHIQHYFNPANLSLKEVRDSLRSDNRLGEAILIRVKMATPNAAPFLAGKDWNIYLEDDAGNQFEPIETRELAMRPIEAIKLELPGRSYEVTDVFGNYYPYIPGEKILLTEKPQEVTYIGNEAFRKYFFPIRNLRGQPVMTPAVSYLKLVVKASEADAYPFPAEAIWKFKKSGRN